MDETPIIPLRRPQPAFPQYCLVCLTPATVTAIVGRRHYGCGSQAFVEDGQMRVTPCPQAVTTAALQRNQIVALSHELGQARAQIAALRGEPAEARASPDPMH